MSRTSVAGHELLDRNDALLAALESAVPGGVRARPTDRLAHAHDASHYLLTPQAVVVAGSATDVGALLRTSAEQGVPLTFRSGGTSLSGQAGTSGILVDTRRAFRTIEVLDEGARVRVEPGATVRSVNARLARYGRKLGPDPASEAACTIGGVVANNSSGMACGTEANTYRTLESAVLVLPSGTVVDTASSDADYLLRVREPRVYAGLSDLRDRVRGNASSVATIERLFAIKNTMGYGVNAFLDHDRPVDLLARLVIGSEGTLAFVAEATFRTVPLHPHAATALLLFPDLAAATGALPQLVASDFATLELLDATSLRVAQSAAAATPALRGLAVRDHAALLVEHQQPTEQDLQHHIAWSAGLFASLPLAMPAALSTDAHARTALWNIRKGLYAAVAGARPSGTTALLEDIAVPVDRLLPTCRELTHLFERHGYADSVIFGHAKDGNIHFLVNERFGPDQTFDRYLAFTDDMVDLVLGEGGTLKAEHGTGRMMAPYVRRQYGDELFEVMQALKRLLDPQGVLSPGVLLDEDPRGHVRHLKSTPAVDPEIDRCVECGYCEPVCPSKDLTTTPRQRIVLRREIARAVEDGDHLLAQRLEKEFEYDGLQTCAADGMCQTACPVLIDTGDLTRRLRAERAGGGGERVWATAARHWGRTTRAAAGGLSLARTLPDAVPRTATAAGRSALGRDVVPAWSSDLPGGGSRRTSRPADHPVAVFFPACIGTIFGPAEGGAGVSESFLTLCDLAQVPILVPEGIAATCCGTPWKSKGMSSGLELMRERVLAVLTTATLGGELPVVVDAASCTEGLAQLVAADAGLRIVDAVAFVADHVLPKIEVRRRLPSLTLHPTCSSTHLGLGTSLDRVASAIADDVVLPADWGCCAFAGDRGLLHPELTSTATADEARAVARVSTTAYASLNRTCELGMTRATGQIYRHVLELLEEAVRP